jgi:hypothetical protein
MREMGIEGIGLGPHLSRCAHGELVYLYHLHDDTISAVDVRKLAMQAVAVM